MYAVARLLGLFEHFDFAWFPTIRHMPRHCTSPGCDCEIFGYGVIWYLKTSAWRQLIRRQFKGTTCTFSTSVSNWRLTAALNDSDGAGNLTFTYLIGYESENTEACWNRDKMINKLVKQLTKCLRWRFTPRNVINVHESVIRYDHLYAWLTTCGFKTQTIDFGIRGINYVHNYSSKFWVQDGN